jgi:AraC-like DNA-binding protein
VAADAGYFDQAHLTREFHAFAGCSPTRWMADEIGFVQATAAGDDDD